MKKILINIAILILWLFTCNCGSGMVGLLRTDKFDRIVMSDVYTIDKPGYSFLVEIIDYYEPGIKCEGLQPIENVFYLELNVWKIERIWGETESESKLLENGYIGPVVESLHLKYYDEICGN